MNDKSIKLNNEISMDLLKFRDGKLLLQANTGGGKSWAIRRILEQSFGKIPQIILDTEGEFHTLREKFDYILIGKDHETKPDPKTAKLLAHTLIRERVSAIIDLFEMTAYDRELFVKNFVDAMTNAPKDLWLPTLLVVDEAQTYAPEGSKSECGTTLHDAAFKFRKRHFGIIFVTPRIAVLSKNVSSTCRNKLIGYTSEPNDVKRAAYELGFTDKDEWRSLRDLDPGQFFAFGPAISKEVIKINMGEVKTSHGEEGDVTTKIAPPSEKVKKALAALAILPQVAAEEAKTVAELKQTVRTLKSQLGKQKVEKAPLDQKVIDKMISTALWKHGKEWEKVVKNWVNLAKQLLSNIGKADAVLKSFSPNLPPEKPDGTMTPSNVVNVSFIKVNPETFKGLSFEIDPATKRHGQENVTLDVGITGPEQRILDALAWFASISIEDPQNVAVAFLAGYSANGGAYNNPKGKLRVKGLIEYKSQTLSLTEEGKKYATVPDEALTTEELHKKILDRLPRLEKKLMEVILSVYPNPISNEELAQKTNYSMNGGAFNSPRGRLRSLGLIEYQSGQVIAKSFLFL